MESVHSFVRSKLPHNNTVNNDNDAPDADDYANYLANYDHTNDVYYRDNIAHYKHDRHINSDHHSV